MQFNLLCSLSQIIKTRAPQFAHVHGTPFFDHGQRVKDKSSIILSGFPWKVASLFHTVCFACALFSLLQVAVTDVETALNMGGWLGVRTGPASWKGG